jgi:hypothetical protein
MRAKKTVKKPAEPPKTDAVRARLARLGIDEQDVADAVDWERDRGTEDWLQKAVAPTMTH